MTHRSIPDTLSTGAYPPPIPTPTDPRPLLEQFHARGQEFFEDTAATTTLIELIALESRLADPATLFQLATIAMALGRVEDAGTLFYVAQIRMRVDIARYGWENDGNSPATVLAALSQAVGQEVNPAVMRDPAVFRTVVERVEQAPPIAATDALYASLGVDAAASLMPRSEAEAMAKGVHASWVAFHRPLMEKLQDPANAAAFALVQDVNFGRIERTDANAAEIDAAQKIVQQLLGESD